MQEVGGSPGATTIRSPGVAKPTHSPDTDSGGVLHRQMLTILDDKTRGGWRTRWGSLLGKFRRLKLGFVLRQRDFPTRLLNFLTYLSERGKLDQVHYFPPVVYVDANSSCNLRCPGCATGLHHANARLRGAASLELMKTVIDQSAPRALQIGFFQAGEPLLNRDFFAACQYANEKGLWTVIHSHLSLRGEGLTDKLANCGLCNLVVSCDGASQDAYGKYRVGGDVDLVFRNIAELARKKARLRTDFPWITPKFLVFDHNWHEIRAFKDRAMSAGADEVMFAPAGMGGIQSTRRAGTGWTFDLHQFAWTETVPSPGCKLLWDELHMDFDSAVWPCCLVFENRDLFVPPREVGNVDVMADWNSSKFVTTRRFFAGQSDVALCDLPSPCSFCSNSKKWEQEMLSRTRSHRTVP